MKACNTEGRNEADVGEKRVALLGSMPDTLIMFFLRSLYISTC